jgi:hypothetical protein
MVMLHPVMLMPAPSRRVNGTWKLALILVLLPLASGLSAWYAPPISMLTRLQLPGLPSWQAISTTLFTRAWGSLPQATAQARPVGTGIQVPFTVCYADDSWQPPPVSLQSQHLQASSRYDDLRGAERYAQLMHDLGTRIDRVHIELQPNSPGQALADFIDLSGLWTDAGAANPACPPGTADAAELWALQLQIDRFELAGSEMTAIATPRSAGVEVVQLVIPNEAQVLHVADASGAMLVPDVNPRPSPEVPVSAQASGFSAKP